MIVKRTELTLAERLYLPEIFRGLAMTFRNMFGPRFTRQYPEEPLPVTSIKGHIGHTAGAAGVMNLIAGLCGMKQDGLVPTAGTTELDSEVQFHVPLAGRPAQVAIETLQVNSFGFGGQDASMVVTRN